MAQDTTTNINLDFKCEKCDTEFSGMKTAFYLSTDRKDGVEHRSVKAKCGGCKKWGEYPYEIKSISRVTTGLGAPPKWRSGLQRMRMDSTPSDFADIINESNAKLAENGFSSEEEGDEQE